MCEHHRMQLRPSPPLTGNDGWSLQELDEPYGNYMLAVGRLGLRLLWTDCPAYGVMSAIGINGRKAVARSVDYWLRRRSGMVWGLGCANGCGS